MKRNKRPLSSSATIKRTGNIFLKRNCTIQCSILLGILLIFAVGCSIPVGSYVSRFRAKTHFNFYMVLLPRDQQKPGPQEIKDIYKYPNLKRRSMPNSRITTGVQPTIEKIYEGARYVVVAPTTTPAPDVGSPQDFKPMTIFFMPSTTNLSRDAPSTISNGESDTIVLDVANYFLTEASNYTLYWTHDHLNNSTVFSLDITTKSLLEWKENDYLQDYIYYDDTVFTLAENKEISTLYKNNNGPLVFTDHNPFMPNIIIRADEPYIFIAEMNLLEAIDSNFTRLSYQGPNAIDIANYQMQTDGQHVKPVYTLAYSFKKDSVYFLRGYYEYKGADTQDTVSYANRFATEDYIMLSSARDFSFALAKSPLQFAHETGWAMLSDYSFTMHYRPQGFAEKSHEYKLWGYNFFKDLVLNPQATDYDATKADYFR